MLLAKNPYVQRLISLSIEEDLGMGDVTTSAVVLPNLNSRAILLAKQDLIVCGQEIAQEVFRVLDQSIGYEIVVADGTKVSSGTVIARVSGPAIAVLEGERTALNFIQRMTGVATITSRYAALLSGSGIRLTDTRKTVPGWRVLDKYAIVVGGGQNHRFNLGSGILIKDNHIAIAGSVSAAVQMAKTRACHSFKIEVEVTNLEQLRDAIHAGADIVLLDNMDDEQLVLAVKEVQHRCSIEVSGGITFPRLAKLVRMGIQFISVGALTHSAPAADISLEIVG